MKYKPITDLTDREVRRIIKDVVDPEKIGEIVRRKEEQEIEVAVKTGSFYSYKDSNGRRKTELATNYVILKDPFSSDEDEGISFKDRYDPFTLKQYYQYMQFCFAKGVCGLLKDNPYLEVEDE